MDAWLSFEWDKLLVPKMSVLEIIVHGVLAYVILAVLLRIIPKRQAGSMSPNDMLVLVLIGGFATKIMAHEAHSLVDFLLMAGSVLGCSYFVNWLSYRFPRLRPWLESPPTPIVRDGEVLLHNLHRELLSREELAGLLRRKGVKDIAWVEEANVEVNGEISVVKKTEADIQELVPDPEVRGLLPGLSLDGPRAGFHDKPGWTSSSFALPTKQRENRTNNDERVEDAELAQFLRSMDGLRAKIEWHQERSADHQEAVNHYKEVLAERGIRLKSVTQVGQSPHENSAAPALV